jgi:hypothetical protein
MIQKTKVVREILQALMPASDEANFIPPTPIMAMDRRSATKRLLCHQSMSFSSDKVMKIVD